MDNYMNIVIKAIKQWVNDKFSSWDLAIDNKVDKIDGKGLSTEDYTTEEKEKLASIDLEAMLPEVTENDNGEVLTVVDGKWNAKNIPQADWNQNDAAAADYVKNRTHYEYKEKLVDNLTNEDYQSGNHPNCTFIVGNLYDVIWNDELYENLICSYNDGWRVLGSDNNDLPFYIDDDGGNNLYIDGDIPYTVTIFESAIHKIDKKYLPEDIGLSSDWNQNDPTAKDYVKNRTHWIDNTRGTLIASIEECEFYDGWSDSDIDITSYGKELVIGKTYHVIWDGIEYSNLIAFSDDEYPTLGAPYSVIGDEYPFNIYTYEEDDIIYLGAGDDGSNAQSYHSFSVYENDLIYHPLDERFIPDAIARIDEIPSPLPEVTEENNNEVLTVVEGEWSTKSIPEQKQADWDQLDETAVDYIKNKPFYITQEAQYKPIFENWTVSSIFDDKNVYSDDALYPDLEEDLLIEGAKYKIIFKYNENIYEHIGIAQDISAIYNSQSQDIDVKILGLSNVPWNNDLMQNVTEGYAFIAIFEGESNSEYIYTPNGIGQFILRHEKFIGAPQITISLYQIISEEKKIAQRYTHHADWNENTYNADGYIKNRPLYLVEDTDELIFDQNITFVPGEQFSPEQYSFTLDFNKETDRILAVWDGVPYLCSPIYGRLFGSLENSGFYTLYDVFILGYVYVPNQLQDFPFHIEAYRPVYIAQEYGGLTAIAYIGIKQIPEDEEETHNLKLYKVGKNWKFDKGLIYDIQSNWEENSPDAIGFIKNRPMYKTLGTNANATILTLNNIMYSDSLMSEPMTIDPISFAYNTDYQVGLYDQSNIGSFYRTKVQYFMGNRIFCLGNVGLLNFGTNTGEPFCLIFVTDDSGQTMVMVVSLEEYTTIEIKGYEVIYTPLDIKYLPKGLQTILKEFSTVKEDASTQSDWSQTDEVAIDYIKNKPDFNSSKISLQDQGNGLMYDIILYNGELVIRPSGAELVITTLPNKLSYNYDEVFDPTGMIVSLMRSDGTVVEIKDYTYEVGAGVGIVPITVKTIYLEKTYTTTFEIDITHSDFVFNNNNDGTVSVVSWNGTYNGEPSTYCVLPHPYDNFVFIT